MLRTRMVHRPPCEVSQQSELFYWALSKISGNTFIDFISCPSNALDAENRSILKRYSTITNVLLNRARSTTALHRKDSIRNKNGSYDHAKRIGHL